MQSRFSARRFGKARITLDAVEASLAQLWSETVRRAPAAPAVIEAGNGRAWSRAELASAAAAMRREFPPPGEMRGRRVLLTAPNSAAWLAAWLALQDAGAVPVAMDADEPPAARHAIAQSIGATWYWRGAGLEASGVSPRRRDRRDICLGKLTSGSTGNARAFMFSHAQMAADGRQVCATMRITERDINFALIPLGHSYGLGNLVVPLVLQGTAVVIGSGPWPQVIATEVAQWRPTVFPAVPVLVRLLTVADVPGDVLASVRLIISAGAALPPETAQAFAAKFQRRVHGFYGSSETGGICFDQTGEATLTGRSVGRPLQGVRLTLRRRGRFVVTSAAVKGRGSHSPADRARWNVDGELVLLGRTGRMAKVAGRRLDLAEVERALRAVPGVTDAWACVHPDKAEAVAAVVATERSAAEISAALSERLAAWKRPDRLLAVREMPLTARGKIDSRRLRAMVAAKA